MTPQSAKAKGRRLQQWVRNYILSIADWLEPDDVRSTSMGVTGEDIQLSPLARKCFPIQIECKNKAAYSVYKDYVQAATHGVREPVLIIKQDDSIPLAVVNAEHYFKLWKQIYEIETNRK
jgi:hypothetical protein